MTNLYNVFVADFKGKQYLGELRAEGE